jgi:hypothetical protein
MRLWIQAKFVLELNTLLENLGEAHR